LRRRPEGTEVWNSRNRSAAGSLFERLVLDEEDRETDRNTSEVQGTVRSIKRHLMRLLNARAGGAASAPELGLVDFNVSSVESNDLTQHIAASIRRCIDTYEPRVKVRSVECSRDPDRPLDLNFRIAAEVPARSKNELVEIDLLMRDGRAAHIL